MANPILSNSYASQNPDIPTKARRLSDGSYVQSIGIDIGTGTTSSPVTPANPLPVSIYSGLVPESYDELVLNYTGDNLTEVLYKQAGILIATLTLAYSGSNLIGVTKT